MACRKTESVGGNNAEQTNESEKKVDPKTAGPKVREALRTGLTLRQACKFAGTDEQDFIRICGKNLAETLEWMDAIDSSHEARAVLVEDALYDTARGGSVTAQVFWLTNRMPSRWSRQGDDTTTNAEAGHFDRGGAKEQIAALREGIQRQLRELEEWEGAVVQEELRKQS